MKENKEERKQLAAPAPEGIRLEPPIGRATRAFLLFLVLCAVAVAVFAAFWIVESRDRDDGTGEKVPSETVAEGGTNAPTPQEPPIPADAVPIIAADLSGVGVRNETAYTIDPSALRALIRTPTRSFSEDEPIVLILHTHAQETYRSDSLPYIAGTLGDAIFSDNAAEGVIAAGDAMRRELVRYGIPTIHCTAIHGESGSLRDSCRSAADCIRAYLERYPSIEYVIDLQRDVLLSEDGACLRTAAPSGAAQILAVVGSDGGGEACPAWRENLGLALCLTDRLEAEAPGSCRQTLLVNSTCNQDLALRSLLLKLGSAGNTADEAVEAAARVGRALAVLIAGE